MYLDSVAGLPITNHYPVRFQHAAQRTCCVVNRKVSFEVEVARACGCRRDLQVTEMETVLLFWTNTFAYFSKNKTDRANNFLCINLVH